MSNKSGAYPKEKQNLIKIKQLSTGTFYVT